MKLLQGTAHSSSGCFRTRPLKERNGALRSQVQLETAETGPRPTRNITQSASTSSSTTTSRLQTQIEAETSTSGQPPICEASPLESRVPAFPHRALELSFYNSLTSLVGNVSLAGLWVLEGHSLDGCQHQPLLTLPVQVNKPPKQHIQKQTSTQPAKDPKQRGDFYANVGEAIRVLRTEIPMLFQKDLTYDIYRDDITFRDPRNTFTGKKDYKTIFWSLRFHGKLFFKMLYVDVLRIWESPENVKDAGTVLKMRWSVHGIPRVPWNAEGIFDGISTFKLDSNGKIFEHAVNNVILKDPPKQGNPFLAGLNLIPLPETHQPCPGAWFKADCTTQKGEKGAREVVASRESAAQGSTSFAE